MLEKIGYDKAYIENLYQQGEKLTENIFKHGYKDGYFIYGYNDDGEIVGGQESKEGKIYLNPQTWVVLAGICKGEKGLEIMDFVEKKKKGGHGCFLETCWLYHYAPETVRLDLIAAESGDSTHRFDDFAARNIKTHFAWMGNYPNSYTASTDYMINERIAKAVTEYCEDWLVQRLRFLKNETISDTYHAEWLAKQ